MWGGKPQPGLRFPGDHICCCRQRLAQNCSHTLLACSMHQHIFAKCRFFYYATLFYCEVYGQVSGLQILCSFSFRYSSNSFDAYSPPLSDRKQCIFFPTKLSNLTQNSLNFWCRIIFRKWIRSRRSIFGVDWSSQDGSQGSQQALWRFEFQTVPNNEKTPSIGTVLEIYRRTGAYLQF